MPDWLKEWWPAVALALTVAVVPALRWIVGQIRKGLVGHDELAEVLKAQDRRLKEHIEAHAGVHSDLDRRVTDEVKALCGWQQEHALHHARVEAALERLPKSDAIQAVLSELSGLRTEVRERMAGTDSRLDSLRDLMDRVGHTVERHDQIISEAAIAARQRDR